jgi:hypothetical protein
MRGLVLLAVVTALAGCGGSTTTTVIQSVPATTPTQPATVGQPTVTQPLGGDCGDGGVNSYNVKAESVDCATALQLVAEWEQKPCPSPGTCAAAGFVCAADKRGVEATYVKCTQGPKIVTWDAGA